MLFSPKGKIRSGYGLAFLLLLISYLLIFRSTTEVRNETNWMTHSYVVINQLEGLHTAITQAETSIRGYIITKDSVFLNSYYSSIGKVPDMNKELERLTASDKQQRSTLDTLERLVEKKLEQLSSGRLLFLQANQTITKEMESRKERSVALMDSVRLYITKMASEEESLMQEKKSKLSGFLKSTQSLTIFSLITAVLAILYSLVTYNHEYRAKRFADEKTNQYRAELEKNIRELKEINDELQELKGMEKFSATGHVARTIAHEVRNPLTNISLAAEQLQEMAMQNNESSMLLDMISRNAVRINQLVSDLLNATKFVQLDMQKTNVNQLLDETLEMARDRIELNHIKVERNYSKDICTVAADAEKLRFALLNIIVNGIEAMEKNKGILQLTTKKEGSKCVIEIRDNGSGMDEDTIQKVFDPYFTGKTNGTGLGLTNTQNIIMSHKGSMKVSSRPLQGTVFIISLDLA